MEEREWLKEAANSVVETCSSTNTWVRKLGEQGFPEGTWISARKQAAGRGRLGRKWESPEGNLYLSLLVRELPVDQWTWVPLATGVGVIRALRAEYPSLQPLIKWPNDIWIEGAKVGGILCEGAGSHSNAHFIVIGIGLNYENSPQVPGRRTISIREALGQEGGGTPSTAHLDRLRKRVLESVLEEVQGLKANGSSRIEEAFETWGVFKRGTPLSWGEKAYQGQACGLGDRGELLVQCSEGKRRSLVAEEVSVRVLS